MLRERFAEDSGLKAHYETVWTKEFLDKKLKKRFQTILDGCEAKGLAHLKPYARASLRLIADDRFHTISTSSEASSSSSNDGSEDDSDEKAST